MLSILSEVGIATSARPRRRSWCSRDGRSATDEATATLGLRPSSTPDLLVYPKDRSTGVSSSGGLADVLNPASLDPVGEWTSTWSRAGIAVDHLDAAPKLRRRSGVLPTELLERPVDGECGHPAGIGRVGIGDPRLPAA